MSDNISVWVAGARPNTLPAALAPVLAGAAVPAHLGIYDWPLALLCFVVALGLQIGVNYANDYSDGVRGTDDDRVGPVRLTASGLASPAAVKRAAFICFGVSAVAGLAVVAISGHWWLLVVGALCILAAWFYTGGKKPYGYLGLGEVFVFVFFGLVAVGGTAYVIGDGVPPATWAAATAIGALASALLVVNNLRDLAKDQVAGKLTLATRLGDVGTRRFYVALIGLAALAVVIFAALTTWAALIALLAFGMALRPVQRMLSGATGTALIPLLRGTSMTELGVGLGLLVGTFVG
ncbi:1,4-dihydroxy-2-naphthoate polyprenyltransferase [Tessaracoccus sp. OS52]|uniref:1,4-dihydroxy-2-naphthoate polyprenyltransferase n=1 Tax=Tessaracoccus sp. OS52 TaxID=2886691 RepID=UPI001D102037|nr:1,4-dihydroxy-2-naphthoate polyprenyltransferase [Tessaracoccus sp. OS52]MCC2592125.1 1,4-dihydroxy-2-naphthoate polyprenyltransferase [Tessaracoccus sp. OS52]